MTTYRQTDPWTGLAGWVLVRRASVTLGLVGLLVGCGERPEPPISLDSPPTNMPFVVVLGNAQDGGHPQAGTAPGPAWSPERRRYATSLAVVDPSTGERWLFEATPDFRDQLHALDRIAPSQDTPGLAGIFLTHAHIGHYTGLIHLGREAMGAQGVSVYAMPRMIDFLSTNGPWDQLVELGNIDLLPLQANEPVQLNDRIAVTAILVPHRDEYSETVGYLIDGPERTLFFLPDIDKWERWEAEGTRIEDVVAGVDVAYLDGTFFEDGEIPGRAMSEIPHPFVVETMARFRTADASERAKIRFIHLNRTNPALFADSPEHHRIESAGFNVAEPLEIVGL
ncbi:MAG: MBL fold metallo-hydrolase [Gemmatimonadota bacterium]